MKTFLFFILLSSSVFAVDFDLSLSAIKFDGKNVDGCYADVIENYPDRKKEIDSEIVSKLEALSADDEQTGKAVILLKACAEQKIEVSQKVADVINAKVAAKQTVETIEINGISISQPIK